MLERKKSARRKCRKMKSLSVMSSGDCFISHAPSPWSVSVSQVYSFRILLGSDAALSICSDEDRTTVIVNYSIRTPTPQSLLGSLPVRHQHFFPSLTAFLTYISCTNASQKVSSQVFLHTLLKHRPHFTRGANSQPAL